MNYITEDDIADWINKKKGIMLTRKYNTFRRHDLNNSYVCLTGYGNIINKFKSKILPKIKTEIIIVIIESDVIKIPKEFLENKFVKRIFQWNKEIEHEKIKCIPIGLNKDRQLQVLLDTEKNISKEKLILLNFSINSHPLRKKIKENKELLSISSNFDYLPPDRVYCNKSFADGRIRIAVTNKNYYKELGKYKFVLSPRGAGEDCHRTWEALYMGCIPIVLSSSIDEIYQDLPVLVIKCWSEITEELLNKTWEEYQKKEWNLKKLYLDYWFDKFEEIEKL